MNKPRRKKEKTWSARQKLSSSRLLRLRKKLWKKQRTRRMQL